MKLLGFHHHPDNVIYLRDAVKGDLVLTPEEFSTYLGETYPGLPAGCKEWIYDAAKGINILKTNDDVQIAGGPLLKQKGDRYIEKQSDVRAAKATAEAVKLQLAEEAVLSEQIK
jgi:hypothetical protein